MRLRARRRQAAVWRLPGDPGRGYGSPGSRDPHGMRRVRRCVRIGFLLTVIALIRLARGVRGRWRPLLAGSVLTAAGVWLRATPEGIVVVPGLAFFLCAPFIEARPQEERRRRSELERELAAYSTPRQRRDLEATLDRYPDAVTYELREILAHQDVAARGHRIPGAGSRLSR
jgi:hypothetical protein